MHQETSLPWEGSLAGQELRPCQKVGEHRETTWDVRGRRGRGSPEQHGVLLSKGSTECDNVRVDRREYRAEEKVCQSSILGMKHEQKISIYQPVKSILDKL